VLRESVRPSAARAFFTDPESPRHTPCTAGWWSRSSTYWTSASNLRDSVVGGRLLRASHARKRAKSASCFFFVASLQMVALAALNSSMSGARSSGRTALDSLVRAMIVGPPDPCSAGDSRSPTWRTPDPERGPRRRNRSG
jgi:hypothetical protein